MANAKPRLLPTRESVQQVSVRATLMAALDDQEEFSIVLVVAAVREADGTTGVRVLGSTATHFERIGLLEEGKDAILID